jgi:preprotein translocase subunit SecE
VARETRRQRRDARRASGGDEAAAARPRGRSQGGQLEPAAAGPAPVEVAHHAPRRRGSFIRESYAELQKVEWPNRSQVIQGTIVVIVACAIVGAYLYGADQVLRRFVQNILLGA